MKKSRLLAVVIASGLLWTGAGLNLEKVGSAWYPGPSLEVAASQAANSVTTVVTKVSANQAADGYIIETRNGRFEMAYGAGGYGQFDVIYTRILKSMDNKTPVTIVHTGGQIEDVK